MHSRIPAKGMHIHSAAVGSVICTVDPPAARTGMHNRNKVAKITGIFFKDKTSFGTKPRIVPHSVKPNFVSCSSIVRPMRLTRKDCFHTGTPNKIGIVLTIVGVYES